MGLHLQSLRGNHWSHYKRQAQPHIVRAALQPYVSSADRTQWPGIVVLGDLNSSETDPRIEAIGPSSVSADCCFIYFMK